VTVLAEIDEHSNVVATWYGRTVINSARQMYYEQAQAMLDKHDGLAITNAQKDMIAELRKHIDF